MKFIISYAQTVKYFSVLLFFTSLTGCFEYDEVIHFNNNFEGSVDISYTVPLKRNSNDSLIKFLPTDKNDLEKKVNKGFLSKKIKINHFKFEIIIPEESTVATVPHSLFKRRGRVTFSVEFTDLSQMGPALLGSLFVRRKDNAIKVKREFKTMAVTDESKILEGEKKIISETVRLLSSGYMSFRVEYPKYAECFSDKGDLFLGSLTYRIPLTDTMDKKGNLVWDYRIKIIY